ncbi:MAG: SRPBCC domain-containing protein [Deltaproteobacteria bacterium]|nr:SRPBCC domain-containing protein [Deltaproteobacteria bacterium]
MKGDGVRVATFVAVAPGRAFELFTRDIGRWWLPGPRFRFAGPRDGTLRFEGGAGGRLIQERGGGEEPFVVGAVRAWEPAARLVVEWRLGNFAPGEATEVEVRFEAQGRGTRVTVEHRGFASLRPDHPVRHGEEARAFAHRLGRWWGELLTSLREASEEPPDAA